MILGICSDPDVLSVMKLIKTVVLLIKIIVPVALIITSMIEFVKAMISTDMPSAFKLIVNKIIAAVIIFLIPTVVGIIFNVIDYKKVYSPCFENATKEGINKAREEKSVQLIELTKNTLLQNYYYDAKSNINKIENKTTREKYTKELEAIESEILAARKEREERDKNSHAVTGTYTKTETMDTDEATVKNMSKEEFIEFVASMAQDIYHENGGVLPSITIAQACYESGYGKSFEVGSYNLYGLIGYPDFKPKAGVTRKFDNFYDATYYHYKYFEVFSDVYAGLLQKCEEKDAYGAAAYLPAYAAGQSDYGTTVQAIISDYDLTKYDN